MSNRLYLLLALSLGLGLGCVLPNQTVIAIIFNILRGIR